MKRFHIINVGLPRTGTKFVASAFGGYRTAHEFQFKQTMEQLLKWKSGQCGEDEMKERLREREAVGMLEMDAAFFHQYYVELLLSEFPQARFVLTIRDPYSWINSFVDMLLRWLRFYQVANRPLPPWQVHYGNFIFGHFDAELFGNPVQLRNSFPEVSQQLVRLWASTNKHLLEVLPESRTLTLKTSELGNSLGNLAELAELETNELGRRKLTTNDSPFRFDWSGAINPELLAAVVERESTQQLREMFAGVTPDFYSKKYPASMDWENYLSQLRDLKIQNYGVN